MFPGGCGQSCRWPSLRPVPVRASGEMVTAGVSKTPGGDSLPVRVRPRAFPPHPDHEGAAMESIIGDARALATGNPCR